VCVNATQKIKIQARIEPCWTKLSGNTYPIKDLIKQTATELGLKPVFDGLSKTWSIRVDFPQADKFIFALKSKADVDVEIINRVPLTKMYVKDDHIMWEVIR